jgi:hypothetical protein
VTAWLGGHHKVYLLLSLVLHTFSPSPISRTARDGRMPPFCQRCSATRPRRRASSATLISRRCMSSASADFSLTRYRLTSRAPPYRKIWPGAMGLRRSQLPKPRSTSTPRPQPCTADFLHPCHAPPLSPSACSCYSGCARRVLDGSEMGGLHDYSAEATSQEQVRRPAQASLQCSLLMKADSLVCHRSLVL